MKNILVISGHPNIEISNANKIILDSLKENLEGVQVRYLDKIQNNYSFNVEEEQKALIEADVIIFQFPFQWFSMPAILKKWVDDVFNFGFAFGTAYKLEGKKFLISFTTGGAAEVYTKEVIGSTLEENILPLLNIGKHTKMISLPTVYSTGMTYVEGVHTAENFENLKKKATAHAEKIVEILKNA